MTTYLLARDPFGFDADDEIVQPVVVSISPTSAEVDAEDTQQFTATVSGGVEASTLGVTWSVEGGAGNGSVTSGGLYTAPATPGVYFVVATSVEDTSIAYRAAAYVAEVPDSTAPVVTVISPPAGSNIQATTPLKIQVTDNLGDFRRIIVHADFPSRGIKEVVHDGDNFGPNYEQSPNDRTTISNGYEFTLLRRGGWIASPTLTAYAIDADGNEST